MTEKCTNCYNKCFLKECACGCGYIITDRDSNSRLRTYRHGHGMVINLPHSVGKDHYNWKGGKKYDTRGYLMIRVGVRKYRPEHVIVMEQTLGRQLTEDEAVHHKNGIKDDNRLENLQLVTKSEHSKIHNSLASHHKKLRNAIFIRNTKGQFITYHLQQ